MKPLKHNVIYSWEFETADGVVLNQYEEDGKENTWKGVNPDQVVRVSFLPAINLLPRHDILIDIGKGDRFVRRFGRGFMKTGGKYGGGWDLKLYANCVVTNRCRYYIISNGRTFCTHRDHEIRL